MTHARGDEVVLQDARDRDDWRSVRGHPMPNGGVRIEGHDLGPSVERFWGVGNTEYEWARDIAPEHLPAAVAALGGEPGGNLLAVMAGWARHGRGAGAAGGRRADDHLEPGGGLDAADRAGGQSAAAQRPN